MTYRERRNARKERRLPHGGSGRQKMREVEWEDGRAAALLNSSAGVQRGRMHVCVHVYGKWGL